MTDDDRRRLEYARDFLADWRAMRPWPFRRWPAWAYYGSKLLWEWQKYRRLDILEDWRRERDLERELRDAEMMMRYD